MTNLETGRPVCIRDSHNTEVPSDAELLAHWTSGTHPDALELLIRRHGGMVLGVCRRRLGDTADADDAFQATFLLLVRKAKSLAHPEQVAGWLHAVALRVAQRARTTLARRHERETTIVDTVAPTPPEDTQELRQILDEELDRLPEKYRLPIVLCELEGRTLEEAAQLLGWPKGTVAGRLSRGRDLLRQRLSRRRGLVLPLFLVGGPAPPDPLVSATLATTSSTTAAASRPALLAASALRASRRWLGLLLLLLLTSGALAAVAWQARASLAHPSPPVPVAPSPVAPTAPAAPVGGCHHT